MHTYLRIESLVGHNFFQIKLSQRNGTDVFDQRAAWWDEFSIPNHRSLSVRIEVVSVYSTAVASGITETEFYTGQGRLSSTMIISVVFEFCYGDTSFDMMSQCYLIRDGTCDLGVWVTWAYDAITWMGLDQSTWIYLWICASYYFHLRLLLQPKNIYL